MFVSESIASVYMAAPNIPPTPLISRRDIVEMKSDLLEIASIKARSADRGDVPSFSIASVSIKER